MYGSEIRIWKEKDDSRAVQMDNLKVVEGECDIQRSKTGVILKSSDSNHGLWYGDGVIKCTTEEKNRSI